MTDDPPGVTGPDLMRADPPDLRTGVRPVVLHNGVAIHYLPTLSEPPEAVPEDMILVHNFVPTERGQVNVTKRCSVDGFRFWYEDAPAENRERCGCGWAPDAPEHYDVVRTAAH